MNKAAFNAIVENYAEGIQSFADVNEVLLHIPLMNLTHPETLSLIRLLAELKRDVVIQSGAATLSIKLTALEFTEFTVRPDRRLTS